MAFVVEDGTGVPGANSYAALAFAAQYFSDRGNAAWTGTDPVKETALVQATDYIELIFGRYFIGEMAATTQPLLWPRIDTDDLFGADEIPLTLMKACCEYGVRALSGPLLPDPTIDSSGFSVVTTKRVVGPIEKEFAVVGSSSNPRLVRLYPAADGLMVPLLAPGYGLLRVTR